MNGIYETNESFDFNKLHLLSPTNMNGGNYFIKFRINDKPLYIQPPKCKTKQGIIKAGKRFYCDLMFTHENEDFIHWIEKLEIHCRNLIYENREKWFDIELDEHDIENSFTSSLKIFKSGKYYISRTNVPTTLGVCSLKIYNEDEEVVDIENIEENTDVMTILEIQGIKCSTKNFQIEIELKQMMVLKSKNLFEKCLLKGKEKEKEKESQDENIKKEIKDSLVDFKNEEFSEENIIKNSLLNEEFRSKSNVENETKLPLSTEESSEKIIMNDNYLDEINEEEKNYIPNENKENEIIEMNNTNQNINEICEFDFDLEKIPQTESVQIKRRNEIYYEIYKEAKRKAKIARDLALSSYLEAKHIKNTYLLEDTDDSDFDEETFTKDLNHINKF